MTAKQWTVSMGLKVRVSVQVSAETQELAAALAAAEVLDYPTLQSFNDAVEVVGVEHLPGWTGVEEEEEERPMQLVVLESPYAGVGVAELEINLAYARACMADCLRRGESPFASHLLYTQPGVLDDRDPEQRRLGIEAGFRWREETRCHTVVYCDLGLSTGMIRGILHALRLGLTVEMRLLPGWADLEEAP